MKKIREKISLTILTLIYLLLSFRYFPDQPLKSMIHTVEQLLIVAPILIGGLLIYNSLVRKRTGEKPALSKMLRLALTLGIFVQFLAGISDHMDNKSESPSLSQNNVINTKDATP